MTLSPRTIAILRQKYLKYKQYRQKEKLKSYSINLPIFCDVVNLEKGDTIAKILIYTNSAKLIYNGKNRMVNKEAIIIGTKFILESKTFMINSLDIHTRNKYNYIFVVDVNESILYN